MLIGLTLILILPFSILAAIYLNEYAQASSWAELVRFCVEILASIPSIVYGLFGILVFVRIAGFGMSIMAGSLTLSLMLLPIMMRQTEEALKQVTNSYREASAALGATQFETIKHVVIPSSIPGILVGVLLTIGRIIGESAALLFTVGSFVRMPINRETGLLSVLESGTTLTIRAIIEFKEYGNLEAAAAIGIITIGVAILLNLISKVIMIIFTKK
jgi:phosphate transport system permease protein